MLPTTVTFRGAKNSLSWNAVSDAVRYKVYSTSNSGVYGYIGETEGIAFVDNNILPDTTRTPPVAREPVCWCWNYPAAVTYFDQRKVFGGTINNPQSLFATRIGIDQQFPLLNPVAR